jgi:RND family efflux transporter MFP subunit
LPLPEHSRTKPGIPAQNGMPGHERLEKGTRHVRNRDLSMKTLVGLLLMGLVVTGCEKKAAAPAGAGMQGLPVQTATVSMQPVAQSSEFVATIKSRRSATMMPQVSGQLTQILVHSGDHVKAGQTLMTIDPRQQQATVNQMQATERQKKALFDFNTVELDRQKKLFDAGVTSRDSFDQEQQAFENAKADYESAVESRKTQEQLLGYYTIRAPFDGIVGDIPVHVGDYVSPGNATTAMLTTVDEGKDLEAYIYIPSERSGDVHMGQQVILTDNAGNPLDKTNVNFISPEVDPTLQGILVKAPVHSVELLRNAQLVKARVVWSTKSMAVVPVLAVTRQGGLPFVFVMQQQGAGHFSAVQKAITLGDTVGNMYSVTSGLNAGDKVIVSGTQFLVNGMPVIPIGG